MKYFSDLNLSASNENLWIFLSFYRTLTQIQVELEKFSEIFYSVLDHLAQKNPVIVVGNFHAKLKKWCSNDIKLRRFKNWLLNFKFWSSLNYKWTKPCNENIMIFHWFNDYIATELGYWIKRSFFASWKLSSSNSFRYCY